MDVSVPDFLAEIQSDESLRSSEFPVVGEQIYLAHAGVCPLPRRVSEAMSHYLERSQFDDQETAAGPIVESTRRLLADFLSVSEDEVALVGPTSDALSIVAAGFPFDEGDNVIIYQDDYPSNVYPWLALRERGVEVRSVKPQQLGVIEVGDIVSLIDSKTRLVALASCHFLVGFRPDLDEIGAALHARGVAFCVDGIQSVGAFQAPLQNVDFMAADSHKWMLGPSSAGFLYVSREWQDRLRATRWGWHNLDCPDFVAKETLDYVSGALRYEAGSANLVGLVGLAEAVRLLESVGVSRVSADLCAKRAYLIEGVRRKGYEVLEVDFDEKAWGGMLAFTHSTKDLDEVNRGLKDRRVRASLRMIRSGIPYLRFSPHFYNTQAELDLALELL